jgi:geranylgeranyl diphosphate synthase type I
MAQTVQETEVFQQKLAHYKQLIDDDIAAYAKELQRSTLQQYGANARLEIDAFLSILGRGGKRIRGALVMAGYDMCGGTDQQMVLQAARAVEMIHAYILIIDDIQDRSPVRRGGPTAHTMLADYHKQHELADDSDHFGISIALNAALAGGHDAQMLLANLDIPAEVRTRVVTIANRTMLITAHGQTNDIMNEVVAEVDHANIERVLEWKTAHYSFLNPLHVGMTLAGAEAETLDAIHDYAMHTGKAFQITDDILGIFGSEHESGKSPLDDIREGKRTVLTAYALEHAHKADQNFLIQMLGNHNLNPVEFARCKDILQESGALTHAQNIAQKHVQDAIQALDRASSNWSAEGSEFLRGLAQYLLARTS